jgi:glycosyltransferase involved in cell wall biosynthesis
MRILFVSAAPLDPRLGGAKPFIELAGEFEKLGWQVELLSLAERVRSDRARTLRRARAGFLRDRLASSRSRYDVVDFDHEYLPFPRRLFSPDTLLVARSVLLCHQVAAACFPRPLTPRRVAGDVVKGWWRRADRAEMLHYAQTTIENADLVNVTTEDDAQMLVRSDVPAQKIVVLPFGLTARRRAELCSLPTERRRSDTVAFVGTFDWRKGGADLPSVVKCVLKETPGTRFRLLGTKGMFPTAEAVVARFPKAVRSRLEVVPTFEPEQLPSLLEDCALGVFPSYLEGFPFSVLEMLAAALPVVAYAAPGPSTILHPELLVPKGDRSELSARIVSLLGDPPALRARQAAARVRADAFLWEEIARHTSELYVRRVAALRETLCSSREVV